MAKTITTFDTIHLEALCWVHQEEFDTGLPASLLEAVFFHNIKKEALRFLSSKKLVKRIKTGVYKITADGEALRRKLGRIPPIVGDIEDIYGSSVEDQFLLLALSRTPVHVSACLNLFRSVNWALDNKLVVRDTGVFRPTEGGLLFVQSLVSTANEFMQEKSKKEEAVLPTAGASSLEIIGNLCLTKWFQELSLSSKSDAEKLSALSQSSRITDADLRKRGLLEVKGQRGIYGHDGTTGGYPLRVLTEEGERVIAKILKAFEGE